MAGKLPIPNPSELPEPKSNESSLSSMLSDMTFIMISIMRNMTPNMSSIAVAVEGKGRVRAHSSTRMARFLFISIMMTTKYPSYLKFSQIPESACRWLIMVLYVVPDRLNIYNICRNPVAYTDTTTNRAIRLFRTFPGHTCSGSRRANPGYLAVARMLDLCA